MQDLLNFIIDWHRDLEYGEVSMMMLSALYPVAALVLHPHWKYSSFPTLLINIIALVLIHQITAMFIPF